jgi:hypothetical protein
MARYSQRTYCQMFDSLLSEELYFSASAATEANILSAIKRVLGRSIKTDCIVGYSELHMDEFLGVHFKLKDPDGEIIQIDLTYGA